MVQAGNASQYSGGTSGTGENDSGMIIVEERNSIGKLDSRDVFTRMPSMEMHYWVDGVYKGITEADLKAMDCAVIHKRLFKKTYELPDRISTIQITRQTIPVACGIEIPLKDDTFVKGSIIAGLRLIARNNKDIPFYLNNENVKVCREENQDVKRLYGDGFTKQYGTWVEDSTQAVGRKFDSVIDVLEELKGVLKSKIANDDYFRSLYITVVSVNLRFEATTLDRLKREITEKNYESILEDGDIVELYEFQDSMQV